MAGNAQLVWMIWDDNDGYRAEKVRGRLGRGERLGREAGDRDGGGGGGGGWGGGGQRRGK